MRPALPPAHCRRFVRSWYAVLSVTQVPLGGLNKLAATFPKAQSVRVKIYASYQPTSKNLEYRKATLLALEKMSVVHFPARQLYITYEPAKIPGFLHGRAVKLDELENPTLSKLAIVGEGEQLCQRWTLEWNYEKRMNIEVEVDTWENMRSEEGYRVTTKKMWRSEPREMERSAGPVNRNGRYDRSKRKRGILSMLPNSSNAMQNFPLFAPFFRALGTL